MLLNGFTSLLSLEMILLMFGGVVVGIIFGAIPGLSATMAIVLFLPITFNMGTTQAFALLVALYIGGVSGGLISAILINIPGSAMSIATCYDGHPMANQGHAQRALGIGVVFSFLGTVISLAIMMVAAPALASSAVKMSSFEIFSMTFCAIALVTGVGSKDVIKSLAAAFFGIALCFIGMAPVDGAIRYTFGNSRLLGGIPLTSAVVGMFAVTEILKTVGKKITADKLEQRHREKIKGFGFTFKEFVGQIKNLIISSAVGLGIGFLPGMGGSLANQVAYVTVQKASKYPEKFGTGIIDGIVASETSNNASIGGAMIPLLALGIPGDGPTAMLLSAFTIHGIVAGPLLFKTSGPLVYTVFAAMIVCSILMLVVEYFGIPIFAKVIDVPRQILFPVVLVICVVAAFSNNKIMFDCWMLLIFGIIGVVIGKFDFPRTPMILGLVLGQNLETNLRRALQLSRGSFAPFFTRPVSCILLVAGIFFIGSAIVRQFIALIKARKAEDAAEAAAKEA